MSKYGDELYRLVSEYLGLKGRLKALLNQYESSSIEEVEAKVRRGELPRDKSFEGYRRVYEDLADAVAIQRELSLLEEKIGDLFKRTRASLCEATLPSA
ncbi:MAG: hypothetical protein N3H31_05620 [Candidatus Nezhaarchaeota archaeon]|nr:hypothetical protein [Candidatus Nezhaarchaeota archaeon]